MANGEIIKKIITKEKFEKALIKGNYKNVTTEARRVIDSVQNGELLELDTRFGSALEVVNARKLDENRYMELLKGC